MSKFLRPTFFFTLHSVKFWTLNTVIFDHIWKWLTHAYAHPPSRTHACTELAAGVQVCQRTKTHLLLFALTTAAICSQSHMSQLDKLEQKPLLINILLHMTKYACIPIITCTHMCKTIHIRLHTHKHLLRKLVYRILTFKTWILQYNIFWSDL